MKDDVDGEQEGLAPQWPWPVVLIVFASVLSLGAAWALSTPIMLVPDEASHTIRAVSLWQGDVLGRRFQILDEGPPRIEAVNFEVHLPAGFRGIGDQTACYRDGLLPAGCATPLRLQEGEILRATSAGAYQPLWYAAIGWPSRVLPPAGAIYAGRLIQAGLAAVFAALAVGFAALLAGRVGVAAAVLGLTPTAVWLFGSMNPNGAEIATAMALWLGLLVLVEMPRARSAAWGVGIAAIGAAWSRPLSPFIATGILLTVAGLTATRRKGRAVWASRPAVIALVVAVLAIVGSVGWDLWAGAFDTFIRAPNPALTPGPAAAESWDLADQRLAQMFGRFGLINISPPSISIQVWAGVVIAVLLTAVALGTWRSRLILVALTAAVLGLPVLAEAATAEELGLTWQGRYTIPVAFGALAVAVGIFGRHRPVPLVSWVISGAAAVALVVGHSAAYLHTMAQLSTGVNSTWGAYLTQPGFDPPGPDLGLLIAVGLGVLGLIMAVLVAPDPVTVTDPEPAPTVNPSATRS